MMKALPASYKALALLLAGALLLTGCSPAALRQILVSERASADAMAETLITTIETQDREALRALFSEQALAEADDIERGMDYVFSLYEGECLSLDYTGGSGPNRYGEGIALTTVDGLYLVETTQGSHELYFTLYLIDEQRPAMEGLYRFRLSEADNRNDGRFYGPGIHYPGRSEAYRREPE